MSSENHRLRLGAAITLNVVQMPAKALSGRSSLSANQTTAFFFVSGFGSGAYSAKLLKGTRQRFSGFSRPRQCGDDVLRITIQEAPAFYGPSADFVNTWGSAAVWVS